MTILFIILGCIAGLIILVLLIALFTKKAYRVERSIVIDEPAPIVYDYLRYLKNQDHFSKWVMTDPEKKKIFTGTDGEVGFIYAWDGNKSAGAGAQEIMGLKPNERIDLEVRFIRPFPAVAKTPFSIETAGENQTKVTWSMSSRMNYPMNFMLILMNMETMLGKDMEKSLTDLKAILEKKHARHIET